MVSWLRWFAVVLQYCTAEYLCLCYLCSLMTWALMSMMSHLSQGARRLAEHRTCRLFRKSLSSMVTCLCKRMQRQKQTPSRVCKRLVSQAELAQRMQLKRYSSVLGYATGNRGVENSNNDREDAGSGWGNGQWNKICWLET